MTKPTRKQFAQTIKDGYPGAMITEADRGLYVGVRTQALASAVQRDAQLAGLGPTATEEIAPGHISVRIFGFPRARR